MERAKHLTNRKKRMRTFLVLICTVALASVAGAAQEKDKSKKQAPKKNQTHSTQHAAATGGGPQKNKGPQHVNTVRGHSANVGGQKTKAKAKGSQYVAGPGAYSGTSGAQKTKGKTKRSQQVASQGGEPAGGHFGGYGGGGRTGKVSFHDAAAVQPGYKAKGKTKGTQQIAMHSGQAATDEQRWVNSARKYPTVTARSANAVQSKTYKVQHFNLQTKARPTTITGVTFQQNRRIVGSQYWQGANYTVFRTYTPVWHERNWWNSHYNRVVFVFGGWYYWNAGWWYPAWGYAPNAYYAYDGPIYGYNDLPPDQVVANVQAALQEQGYYDGRVDGLLGPLTRTALADYQRDHGLYETAAIDRPTLESLRMS
jgi:hypothetical protein